MQSCYNAYCLCFYLPRLNYYSYARAGKARQNRVILFLSFLQILSYFFRQSGQSYQMFYAVVQLIGTKKEAENFIYKLTKQIASNNCYLGWNSPTTNADSSGKQVHEVKLTHFYTIYI